MKTAATEMFGLDIPVFAFSHCRDVVVETSRSGGMGVLGCTYHSPDQLRRELDWIERHVEGRPYGIDVLLPAAYARIETPRITLGDIPKEQSEYLRHYLDEAGIPRLPEGQADELIMTEVSRLNMTREQAAALVDVALEYPIKLIVNALGAPPVEMVERMHKAGVKVGGMVGKVEHARRHVAAGVDILVAQGMEAGGHTGDITSMILWPQVVDAVAPVPVLAAGGIGNGRQMAAALALGAEGVWCGSIWLGTRESDLTSDMKQRLFEAGSENAIQSKARTGKKCRLLDSKLIQAWNRKGAPETLPLPLQTATVLESYLRVERARAHEWLSCPVGQVVGQMQHEMTVKQVIFELLSEFADASERMAGIVDG